MQGFKHVRSNVGKSEGQGPMRPWSGRWKPRRIGVTQALTNNGRLFGVDKVRSAGDRGDETVRGRRRDKAGDVTLRRGEDVDGSGDSAVYH